MDWIQRHLPLLTALGVTGCIAHAAGLYRFAGDSWLSVMTVSDIFAQTWPVIPALAVGLVGGACLYGLMGPRKSFAAVVEQQLKSPKRIVRFWANLKSLTVFFVGTTAISLFLPAVLLLEPKWASVSILIAFAAGAALLLSSSEIPEVERRPAALLASLCFFYLTAAYSVGLMRGAPAFTDAPNDLVVTESSERCVSIVSVMSKGVLFTPDHEVVEFLEWEEVSRIAQNTTCGVTEPSA